MNDLISRQAAIEEFKTPGAVFTYGETTCKAVISRLMMVPPAQPERRWIPITSRPMTAEERKEWSDKLGYELENYEGRIYEHLPDDGEEVIVCGFNGRVYLDTFYDEPDGCIFDYSDIEDVVAWMPKPEPYKGESEGDE